jgi:4'-phosphopantetheinyl transferase
MIKVYYAYPELANEARLKQLVDPLSIEVQNRLLGLKRKENRILKLTASFLLKQTLSIHGYNSYPLQELQYSQWGKPFFRGAAFDFSISHTENCAAIAFADKNRVGIDIEKMKPIDFADFDNIFSQEVWNFIVGKCCEG